MTLLRRTRLLFALASGGMLALAFPPHDLPFVAWVSLAVLMLAAFGASGRLAFAGGLLHGFAFYLVSLPWIYTVMRVHGGLQPAAAAGVLLLMVFILSLFPAVFAWAMARLAQRSIAHACLAAPFLWVALEFGRTHMPEIGFPWNLLGYALVDARVILQLAALTGVYGLSFLLASFNALIAWCVSDYRKLRVQAVAIPILLGLVLLVGGRTGRRFIPTVEPRYVAHLVQTNLPQATSYSGDWMQQHGADLAELEALSTTAAQTRPGLLIWPEVPAPFYLQEARFAAQAARIAQASNSYFLLGVVRWAPRLPGEAAGGRWEGPYNSAALLDPSGQPIFSYDKIHLVAFGEYVPWRRVLRFARQLTAEVGGFQRGHEYAVGQLPAGKFGVQICFEAVFPGEVRRFVANGAELLVNISNDAWFGRSAAPEQHLAMARVRAVENRRWLLRATNNGHTVAVDPYGRIVARLEADRRGVLAAPFDYCRDITLYARFGDWLAWLCVVGSIGFVAVAFRQAT